MKKAIIIIGICILTLLISCQVQEVKSRDIINIINLRVSESTWINGQGISYNGIINNNVFAISNTGRAANNIYYPINTTKFTLYKHNLEIINISPYELTVMLYYEER